MFGLSMIKLVIMGVAVAAPFLTYGVGRVEQKWKMENAIELAVTKEKAKQVSICNYRVGDIERQHELAVVEAVASARSAAISVSETPLVPSELKKLCDASPNCRSRRTK